MAAEIQPGLPAKASQGSARNGGNGINPGYGCGMTINAKPTGGGRVAAGWQTGTPHPSAKNLPPAKPSAASALKGWC